MFHCVPSRKLAALLLTLGVLAGLVALTTDVLAAPPGKGPISARPTIVVDPHALRPDLATKLTITTGISEGSGFVNLAGTVCNGGLRAYTVPPASPVESEYMVYTWHPPKTPAQEANLVFPGHKSIGNNLAVNGCVQHNVRLTVPGVTKWIPKGMVTLPPKPDERLAKKQVVFRLNKNYPNGANFTADEDSDPNNNAVVEELTYYEKVQ